MEHHLQPHIGRLHRQGWVNIGRVGQPEGGGAGEEGVSMKMCARYTTRIESSGAGDVADEIVLDCTPPRHPYFQTA
jgi:hypothetical protein